MACHGIDALLGKVSWQRGEGFDTAYLHEAKAPLQEFGQRMESIEKFESMQSALSTPQWRLTTESSNGAQPDTNPVAHLVLTLVLLGALTSCSVGPRVRALFGEKLQVQVHIADKANLNTPIALDLLLVYDKKLAQELVTMSAREYFAKRDQLKRDDPDGKRFDSWEWEWIPGQQVPIQTLPLKAKARLGLIFASYVTPGEHRARVHPRKDLRIDLLEKTFTVQSL